MYPQAAGERGDLRFFDGDDGKFQQVDVEREDQEGGQDVLKASLPWFVAREEGQGQAEDEECQGGVQAGLPFAEVFGAAGERGGGQVAQAVAGL